MSASLFDESKPSSTMQLGRNCICEMSGAFSRCLLVLIATVALIQGKTAWAKNDGTGMATVHTQLAECWQAVDEGNDAEKITVDLVLTVDGNAKVTTITIPDEKRYHAEPGYRLSTDQAVRALKQPACRTLSLPIGSYEAGKTLTYTFDPVTLGTTGGISADTFAALKSQLAKCWLQAGSDDDQRGNAVDISLTMDHNAVVTNATVVDQKRYKDDKSYSIDADRVLMALRESDCHNLLLPPGQYEQWKTIYLTFDPTEVAE